MDENYALGYMAGQGNNGGNGGWGCNGWGDWILIILLFAVLGGGFGGFGFGGFGGGAGLQGIATRADINAGFQFQDLQNGIRGLTNGLSDSTYALNNSITSGFHGVDNAICTLGYQTQQGFNTLGYAMKDCCCETQRLIERGFCDLGNAVNMQTRDIIENQNANYRSLFDFMVQEKLSSKDAQIAQLQNRLSQSEQNGVIRAAIDASTAEIIRRTGNECPVPAYVVPNPNCCYGNPLGVGYSGYGYGRDGGCGCGC